MLWLSLSLIILPFYPERRWKKKPGFPHYKNTVLYSFTYFTYRISFSTTGNQKAPVQKFVVQCLDHRQLLVVAEGESVLFFYFFHGTFYLSGLTFHTLHHKFVSLNFRLSPPLCVSSTLSHFYVSLTISPSIFLCMNVITDVVLGRKSRNDIGGMLRFSLL